MQIGPSAVAAALFLAATTVVSQSGDATCCDKIYLDAWGNLVPNPVYDPACCSLCADHGFPCMIPNPYDKNSSIPPAENLLATCGGVKDHNLCDLLVKNYGGADASPCAWDR